MSNANDGAYGRNLYYTDSVLLPTVEITAPKVKKTYKSTRKHLNFLGFHLCGGVNSNISDALVKALETYTGPKVLITSLRRNWGTASAHEKGRAVDFDLCPEIVEYLHSEAGEAWLSAHNLLFYVEGRPGCKEVKSYEKDYPEHIFYNPHATGPHIHINIRK